MCRPTCDWLGDYPIGGCNTQDCIEWISGWKVQDLKHLLGDNTNTEQDKTILQEQKKLMLYQGALYHHHTPPLVNWSNFAMCSPQGSYSSCHEWMSPWCWTPRPTADTVLATWPVLVTRNDCSDAKDNKQMWAMHPTWRHSCQSPLQPIIVTAPLELLHNDFTSIETTMELDQPPNVVNVLVFCDHFMKHIMAYVTPNQTAKTVAMFLWQGYILICGAPAKLLSNQGANFEIFVSL